MTRDRDITLGQVRQAGYRLLNVVCGVCEHSIVVDAECWPQTLRISDLERLFVCPVCGHRGADVHLLVLKQQRGGQRPPRPPRRISVQ